MADHVLTETTFESFDLHPLLLQGLADCGFTCCTPIQALTLPIALAGKDVAGQAQTGTGKTCAFLVSLMNHLLTTPARAARKDNDPRALIIAPTRELAIQIDKDARAIGAATGLKTALIYGGVDYDKQRQMLRDGCDIIVATPGRMLDYYKQRVFSLDNVEVMVVDEADRMFDLGFIKDVRYIFRRLPAREERQVLLYSATLSQRVLELAYEHMNDAQKLVAETDHVTADKVRQVVYFPAKEEKLPLLLNLMAREKPERAIVFVNTRAQTDRVRNSLRRYGYRVGALSGDVPQDKRQKVLARFEDGQIDVLVCTDVAARGLHIPHVSHVFNYDLPQDAEDYVHRIGRTARLGEEGDAISFACDLYAMSLPDIETYIGQKVPVAAIEPEWLTMPKAPEQGAAGDSEIDAAQPAGSADHAPRSRNRRSGGAHGHGDGPARASRGRRGPRPAPAEGTAQAASTPAATPAAASNGAASNGATVTPDASQSTGAPRRRRHRGGRNRRRGHAGDNGNATATTTANAATGSTRGEHRHDDARPQGERRRGGGPRSGNGSAHPRPAAPAPAPKVHVGTTQVRATPAGDGKRRGGFLQRLAAGLFGRR
ncbi:MAG TPA: DEAD/DEAH box helicase [Rhodanobacteraceae bacterium]